jgi:hypothetical protein
MDLHGYFHVEMIEYFKQLAMFIDLLAFQMINRLDCLWSIPEEHVGCAAVRLVLCQKVDLFFLTNRPRYIDSQKKYSHLHYLGQV